MKTHYYIKDILEICTWVHLSVEEIYDELKKRHENVWKSSVYRNVEELALEWKLKKVVWIWKKTFYERICRDHIHLIDKKTWEIRDFCDFDVLNINLPKNFKVSNTDIHIYWEFE